MTTNKKIYTIRRFIYLFLFALLLYCLSLGSVQAEVTLDGTLGPGGAIPGPDYQITANLGQQVGANLFHSFGKFNVNTGESATFSGPGSISNIINRVTGGTSSWIDGYLRSEITGANLYLINPSGVMFGPNASLDVSGSFHVSTADYLKLGQDGWYYATTPGNSVLTSAPPSAFGFLGPNPKSISFDETFIEVPSGKTISVIGGDIQMQNSTLHAQGGRIDLASASSAGEVIPGETDLVMEGLTEQGYINVSRDTEFTNYTDIDVSGFLDGDDGGSVYIRSGRFELQGGSIFATVRSDNPGGNVDIKVPGDIVLDSRGIYLGGSIISETSSASSGRGGDVVIEAQNLKLKNDLANGGGFIDTITGGAGQGGDIIITVNDSMEMSGDSFNGLYAESYSIGNPGEIKLNVGKLDISGNMTYISSDTYGGQAGNINITAKDSISISGEDNAIVSNVIEGDGNGGKVNISTPILKLAEGASIESVTMGSGKAGDIIINTGILEISGDFTRITTETFGSGQGGNQIITATESVNIKGIESGLLSDAQGSGDAGEITLISSDLSLQDRSYILSIALAGGNAGNIKLNTEQLTINEGASIHADNFGLGNGGNIDIVSTGTVTLSGPNKDSYRTGIFSTARGDGYGGNISLLAGTLTVKDSGLIQTGTLFDGNSGNIKIDVGTLSLISGGQISARTEGKGKGGNIDISATDSITISGREDIYSSALLVDSVYSGKGGKMSIFTPIITLSDGGIISGSTIGDGDAGDIIINTGILDISGDLTRITTETYGSGQGGYIDISATEYFIVNGSEISSSSFGSGKGGTIFLNMGNLQMRNNAYISAVSYDTGLGGDITIQSADSIRLLDRSSITTETFQSDGGNIEIKASELAYLFNSDITTSVHGGLGNGGNITIDPRFVILNNSSIIANAYGGNGGNIDIVSDYFLASTGSIVQASSQLGISGEINITAPDIDLSGSLTVLPSKYLDATSLLRDRCKAMSDENTSSLVIEGRGGMPIEPNDYLPSS